MAGADLSLAVAFLLVGLGTCAGLVPVHGWLAAASRTGGALLAAMAGAALLVLLRLGQVMDAGRAPSPAPVLMGLGLLSSLVAAWWLVRQRRRRPGLAPLVLLNAGLAAFACGVGRPEAGFVLISAGMLLLPAWAVARPHPKVRATVLAALALVPPFAGFGAALGVVVATMRGQPWLAVPFGLGLAVAVAALARHLPGLWRAPVTGTRTGDTVAALALLVLALAAGIVPAAAQWFEAVARGLP
jgi:hydrogenase-4 component F